MESVQALWMINIHDVGCEDYCAKNTRELNYNGLDVLYSPLKFTVHILLTLLKLLFQITEIMLQMVLLWIFMRYSNS